MEGMEQIQVTKDRDWWRALVNTVMNLRVPQNAEKFLINLGLLSIQGKVSFMVSVS
jgi:hypothetical protein